MPLIDVTPRLRELGRIRTGVTVEGTSKAGKKFKRPEKLSTFRITSPSAALMAAAQAVYGGTVEPWESPAGQQFELITKVDVLPIVIPSGESLSQWYEMWGAGGCLRRCDGRTEVLSDGPCLCPSDSAERRDLAAKQTPEACKPTTRLNVVLPDLPDLGVWRLESHGYYAAVELAGASQFLAMATSAGMNIPAHLRLEQREKKVPGQPTNRYAVPVIEFTTTRISDLIAAGAGPMMLGDSTPAPQLVPGALVPTKAPRARQPKVDRPALGPAPTVPGGDGFGRPNAAAPTATPPPMAGSEPESVAGWVIDGVAAPPATDAPGAAADPAPLSTSAPGENVAATPDAAMEGRLVGSETLDENNQETYEVTGLSREELIAELRVLDITTKAAADKSKAMWPGRTDEIALTDAQRRELLDALRQEQAATAGL